MPVYEGKTVLVTGSSRGIGALLVQHFLDAGASVIGLSRGTPATTHPHLRHCEVDLADAGAVAALFTGLRRGGLRSLDIVVNNAAVLTSQYAMIMPAAAAQAMVNINLLAPFLVAREAAKFMRGGQGGRIIQISSMASRLGPPGDSVYAACKSGLETLSQVLAKEFAPLGITCNTVGVTAIETEMLAQLPRAKIDAVIATLPLPRYAAADDIFNVVDFFASPRSGGITAQTVFLGGVH